jgi:hypothetical protein
MKHSTAQSLELKHQHLLAIYTKIDKLLEKLTEKARKDADAWLKKFCGIVPDHTDTERCKEENHDSAVCNKAIITTFQKCYSQTIDFLTRYLYKRYAIKAPLPDIVFKRCLQQKIITKQEAKKMLKMVDVVDYLCHIYNQEGQHIISTDLVDYYNCMQLIVYRLKIS